jgi:hypothetical protein
MPPPGNVALGFDVALDRSDGTIAAAWRDDAGTAHLEVADHRPGVAWIPERMAELAAKWSPLAMAFDAAGPALDVADVLNRSGAEAEGIKSRDYAAACASMLEHIIGAKVKVRPHRALDEAVTVAARRALGDAWAWGRRQSATSISALTAATVALWAYDHAPAAVGDFRIY